jgi:integrase
MTWKAKMNPQDDAEFIFPSKSPRGWPENFDNFLRRQLKPFGEKIGIANLTFRALRKTAASLFGNDIKSAQAHLGHARPDTTAINYMAAPTMQHVERVAEIDAALLGRKPSKRKAR